VKIQTIKTPAEWCLKSGGETDRVGKTVSSEEVGLDKSRLKKSAFRETASSGMCESSQNKGYLRLTGSSISSQKVSFVRAS
jgi:hypothetical protein